jgi:uncharacterized RDD family membrane protein YckC
MHPSKAIMDSNIHLETPEGVPLLLQPAGIIVRAAAFGIDLGIRALIYTGVAISSAFLGDFGMGIFLVVAFLLEWFYPIWFELRHNGQTPGKKKMGIKVIHDDATSINFGSSFLRNLLRTADFLPMFWGLGILSILFNKDFKRLGDMAAGTLVVYVDKFHIVEVDAQESFSFPQSLTLQEAQTLVQFSERSKKLSKQRQMELADILSPITQRNGEDAVNYLNGVAKGIVSE